MMLLQAMLTITYLANSEPGCCPVYALQAVLITLLGCALMGVLLNYALFLCTISNR